MTVTAATGQAPEPVFYKIAEVVTMTRLSRSVIFEEIRAGRLASVTRGRSRLIPADAVRDYAELLKREAREEQDVA
jgi:hypothetical protein